MNQRVTKTELIKRISDKLSDKKILLYHTKEIYNIRRYITYTQEIIQTVVDTFWEVVSDAIAEGDSIILSNYICITPSYHKGYTVNANVLENKEDIIIQDYCLVRCKPGKKMKKSLKTLCERINKESID